MMALACTKPGDGSNQWTTTRLADATGLAKTRVHPILNEASLKPHRIDQWCGKSLGPEFEGREVNKPPKASRALFRFLKSTLKPTAIAPRIKARKSMDNREFTVNLSCGSPGNKSSTYR